MTEDPFNDLPVIGALPPAAAVAKLREVGETVPEDLAYQVSNVSTFAFPERWPFWDRAWQHTAHSIGFLPAEGDGEQRTIKGVGEIPGDASLKQSRIKVTLNALRIIDYPGGGTHRVLIDFYARNQVPSTIEDLHFNATYRVREGERAAVRSYPVFVGLGVGNDGVAFHFHTVNVKNETDEAFLDFLEGDVFKHGLKLAATAQPAIAPLSGIALAVTKSIARRSRNVSVQDCYLGLDFAGTAMGARLAIGDYIAIQIPESQARIWYWDDWVYESGSGLIVSREHPSVLVPYNYLAFGVSRYEDD